MQPSRTNIKPLKLHNSELTCTFTEHFDSWYIGTELYRLTWSPFRAHWVGHPHKQLNSLAFDKDFNNRRQIVDIDVYIQVILVNLVNSVLRLATELLFWNLHGQQELARDSGFKIVLLRWWCQTNEFMPVFKMFSHQFALRICCFPSSRCSSCVLRTITR